MALVVLGLPALLGLASDEQAVPGDTKYVRCDTCRHLVGAVHETVAAARKASRAKKLSEETIQTVIESVCDPAKDEGAWLKFLDMVETDAQRIKVERQPEDGPCGTECKTLALTCQQLLEEGWENELGEALFSSTSADELVESACKEWSSACRKAPPKVDKARKPGPAFRPYTEDERALEAYQSGKPNAPGVFGDEQLKYSLGVGPAGGVSGMGDDFGGAGGAVGMRPMPDDFDRGVGPGLGQARSAPDALQNVEAFVPITDL